ncbi:MAG TPA: site-specific integrase [Gemmata sp.]|nr:site-specific integrase [Gemmata sp.]
MRKTRLQTEKEKLAAKQQRRVSPLANGNSDRQEYVPVETIQAVLDACPSAEWRLIVALSRFGGLRCPSEHLGIAWADIHWDTGRFTVHSPKTEHIEGKAVRIVPIFPELYPYLRDAFEAAKPGETNVITRNRCDSGMNNGATTNWRTTFLKIIRKAGVKPWPKLFHGLRASCQTDLANKFPGHVVCEWLGDSLAIAQEHYLQVTEDHYRQATQNTTQTTSDSTDQRETGYVARASLPLENAKTLGNKAYLVAKVGLEPTRL